MATCSKCKSTYTPLCKCPSCGQDDSSGPTAVVECPKLCSATIYVQNTLKGVGVDKIPAKLDSADVPTDPHGFSQFKDLPPGAHVASISLAGLEDKYAWPIGTSDAPVSKTIAVQQNEFYVFNVEPLTSLKVTVKRRHDSNGMTGAKLKITPQIAGNVVAPAEQTTPAGGDCTFKRLRQDSYKIEVALDDSAKAKYELEETAVVHPLDMTRNPDERVLWARLVVHLRLKYTDPDKTIRAFPKDFPVKVLFDDATSVDLKVLDDSGYFKFEVADAAKKKFTLKFDSTKTRYLVHPSRAMPDPNDTSPAARKDPPKTKLFEDPSEEQLLEWTTDDKKFFALPKTWALVHSTWTQADVTVKADGQIDVGEGAGTVDKPAELTLEPKFQYVRFEFHDRKFGGVDEPHADKRVSIPPIVLKGSRESNDAGAPINPISGSHDATSNWMIHPDDGDTACQVLPWIKLKDDAGMALPKFNNKMLLELGWKNAFVESTGKAAGDRKIIVLPPDDARRKPGKNRPQYYDLPEAWKSKWYYTRLSDENKNKFFDKFLSADDPDLEGSLAEGGKLTFSLDDIVLVDAAGNQETIQDKQGNLAETSTPLSKYSRLTILELNRKDKKFIVKVHDPYDDAKYWSKGGFASESVNGPWRNVIAKYPVNPRVVVFCSQFHDVYDKRTVPADCSGKKIMGARAAKIEDTDISSQKVLMDQQAYATSGYVGYKGTFAPRWHYLHYGEVDGTTVYGALVVYWSATFERSAELDKTAANGAVIPQNGSHADVDLFRDKGMELAMKRWNDKDYYFEENDDKRELRIKTFALLEVKGVKISDGNFSNTGGRRICRVLVRNNEGGSWAMSDGSEMMMRNSGAKDEGQSWGDDPGTLPVIPKFEGGNANPKCAFAHELGHAAFALYDSYLTTYGKLCVTGDQNQKLSSSLCCYENMYADKQDGQEYLGMPYEMDSGALMKVNRAETRLRYAWLRANWLNDQAQPGGIDKLPELLGGRRFRAAYEAPGKPKLKYHRDDADRNVYKPGKSKTPYSLSHQGKCDLHLYRLGDDEYARILKGGPYNGILVVALKICVKFQEAMTWAKQAAYFKDDLVEHGGSFYMCKRDHVNRDFETPGDWILIAPWVDPNAKVSFSAKVSSAFSKKPPTVDKMVSHQGKTFKVDNSSPPNFENYPKPLTPSQKIAQIQTLDDQINAMLTHGDTAVGKYKLYGGGDFSATLFRIFPQWSFETDPGGAHVTITYSLASKAFQPAGAHIHAGVRCDSSTIIRYLLGKIGDDPNQWAAGGLTGDLGRADLGKLSDWMNSNSGGQGFIVADNP